MSQVPSNHPELGTRFKDCVIGDIVEISDALRISNLIGQIINIEGGCALIIDYGIGILSIYFKAVKSHKVVFIARGRLI